MTDRKEYGLKLYKEWKKSGLTQKDFLSTLPKENEFGSLEKSLQIGSKMHQRLEFQKRCQEEQENLKSQEEFNKQHFAFNPIFIEILQELRQINGNLNAMRVKSYTLQNEIE